MRNNRQAARVQLAALSHLFGLPVPDLSWVDENHATYHPNTKSITLPIRSGRARNWETRIVHEFAHYLAHSRAGKPMRHKPEFCEALWEVAEVWYGAARKYPWDTDFKMVARYAQRWLKA